MTKENSPNYRQGLTDGHADTLLISQCPPVAPLGPQPPNPAYPVMYMEGYHDSFDQSAYHVGCDNCRKERAS